MLKWIRQSNKPNRGLIAIRVISGCSMNEVIKLTKCKDKTKTKDLSRALRKLGYNCPNKLIRLKQKPNLAIAKLTYPNTHNWHWVVIENNKIFDGIFGNKNGEVKWKKNWKITSYLPIRKINAS
jgi:hypothetical protein